MDKAAERKAYKIGEVARMLDIAVETIRMYEHNDILLTEKTETGQRIFDENDVEWINCIRRLIKKQGLNMEGIRRLLSLIPCWEVKSCPEIDRENCLAYQKAILPCWAIKDKTPACSNENCRLCNVYLNALRCQNLKKVLSGQEKWKNKLETIGN